MNFGPASSGVSSLVCSLIIIEYNTCFRAQSFYFPHSETSCFWFVSEWLYQAHNAPSTVSGWALPIDLPADLKSGRVNFTFQGIPCKSSSRWWWARKLNFTFWNHLRNAFLRMVSLITLVKIKDLQLSFFSGYVALYLPCKLSQNDLYEPAPFSFYYWLSVVTFLKGSQSDCHLSINQSIFYHLSFVSLLG